MQIGVSDLPPQQRDYEDAVLQACQQTHSSEDGKRKTLFILDTLQLSPFAITDALDVEQNALAHPSVISKISSGSTSVRPIIRTKRKFDGESCLNSFSPAAPGLEHLLAVSPYLVVSCSTTIMGKQSLPILWKRMGGQRQLTLTESRLRSRRVYQFLLRCHRRQTLDTRMSGL